MLQRDSPRKRSSSQESGSNKRPKLDDDFSERKGPGDRDDGSDCGNSDGNPDGVFAYIPDGDVSNSIPPDSSGGGECVIDSKEDDPFASAEEEGRHMTDPDPISEGEFNFKLACNNVSVMKNMFACMSLLTQAPMFVEKGRLFTTGMDASGICMISGDIRVKVSHLRGLERQQFTVNVSLMNKLLKTFPSNGSIELYILKDDERLCIRDIPEANGAGQSGVRKMYLLDDQEPHKPIRHIKFLHTVEILKTTFDAVLRMACDFKADTIHFSILGSKSTCFFVLRGTGEAEFEQTFMSRSFDMNENCSNIKILHSSDQFPLADKEEKTLLVSNSFCAKYLNDFCKTMDPCTLTLRFANDAPVMILYNFGSKDIASMSFILAPTVKTTTD